VFNVENMKSLGEDLLPAISAPLLTLRKTKFEVLFNKYPKELDWLISLSVQLKYYIPIQPSYNMNTEFDFAKDLGIILYNYFNKQNTSSQTPQLKKSILSLPFNIQKAFVLAFSGNLVKKMTEEYLMDNVKRFIPMSEIVLEVDLPNTLETSEVSIYSLSRNKNKPSTFPMLAIRLPKVASKTKRICYLLKNGDKVVSNIISSKLRENITDYFKHTSFGLIGFLVKIKGFKHRWSFVPVLQGSVEDIKNIYQGSGVGGVKVVQIPKEHIPSFITPIWEHTVLNTQEDLSNFLYKNYNQSYLYVSSEALGFINTIDENVSAPIVDWILDEDYLPLGVEVLIDSKKEAIRFNINSTNLIHTGISGRYLEVTRRSIGDKVLGYYYQKLLPVWSVGFSCCQVCGGVSHNHTSGGVCSKCANKLQKFVTYAEDKNSIDLKPYGSFEMRIGCFQVSGNPEGIVIKPLEGFRQQLTLPFEEFIGEL